MNNILNTLQTPAFGEMQVEEKGGLRCFYPNKCHICHCFDNPERPLKRCSSCQLISYCGRNHQLKDWKNHKDFCKAIKEFGGPNMFTGLKKLQEPLNASNNTKFRLLRDRVLQKKLVFSQIVSKLNRPPFLFEVEMIMFPRICTICFECDPSLLKSCPNCPQGNFCEKHRNDPSHLKFCHLFKRACEIELANPKLVLLFLCEVKKLKTVTLPFQKSGSRLPESMKDFLKNDSCIIVKRNSKQQKIIPQNLWEIYLTDALSPVLTILYALEKLEFPVTSNLVIHVMGATVDEIHKPMWELILHWLPTVTNLSIAFIGPEVKNNQEIQEMALCSTCERKNLQMTGQVSTEFYQDFMESRTYQKPSLIIAYNAGLHAYFTWMMAIEKVARLRCPFIQTSFTEIEAHEDYKTIKTILPKVKHFYFGSNPFASYYCERNTDDEQVFTRNDILTIYDAV